MIKLNKVKEEFIINQRATQEKNKNKIPPVLGIDIATFSSEAKLVFTFMVFAIFAVGIVYGLGQVRGNKKQNSKKDKKKKN